MRRLFLNKFQMILVFFFDKTGFFTAVSFKLVFLYTSELFPTPIRNSAIGICSTIARIGGIIAILMQGLKEIWPPLTMVIFGAVTGIAAILALKLPETKNDRLPESIEDSLQLGQNVKRNKFGVILKLDEIR